MKPMSTMNVIPFIDIMLVLLAVVLTTATFVAQGKIPVSLPGASSAQPLQIHDTLEITVTRTGDVYVAEQPVSVDALAERIGTTDRQTPVLLRVDQDAAFQHFVTVVDLLKSAQFSNVSIVARQVQ